MNTALGRTHAYKPDIPHIYTCTCTCGRLTVLTSWHRQEQSQFIAISVASELVHGLQTESGNTSHVLRVVAKGNL